MGVVRDRTKSYLPKATSFQLCQEASTPQTGNSPSPRKLPVVFVSGNTDTVEKSSFLFSEVCICLVPGGHSHCFPKNGAPLSCVRAQPCLHGHFISHGAFLGDL